MKFFSEWVFFYGCTQDLKYEENSDKAVQCLNDMVTNALIHMEDCLKYMSALRDPAIFKFCAIPQVDDVLNEISQLLVSLRCASFGMCTLFIYKINKKIGLRNEWETHIMITELFSA